MQAINLNELGCWIKRIPDLIETLNIVEGFVFEKAECNWNDATSRIP